MSILGERQNMVLAVQRPDLPEPSSHLVALYLSGFPENIPCGVFLCFEGLLYTVLIHFPFHWWSITISFLTRWIKLHLKKRKKNSLLCTFSFSFFFFFESVCVTFYEESQQCLVSRNVNNLLLKNKNQLGALVPSLTAKHSLANTALQVRLSPYVDAFTCGVWVGEN